MKNQIDIEDVEKMEMSELESLKNEINKQISYEVLKIDIKYGIICLIITSILFIYDMFFNIF